MSTGFVRQDSGFGSHARSRHACVARRPIAFACLSSVVRVPFE